MTVKINVMVQCGFCGCFHVQTTPANEKCPTCNPPFAHNVWIHCYIKLGPIIIHKHYNSIHAQDIKNPKHKAKWFEPKYYSKEYCFVFHGIRAWVFTIGWIK